MTETKREYTEAEKRDWGLDPGESLAEFEITAIQFPGRIAYTFTDTLRINPYPNPLGFGGMFGIGGAGSVPELIKRLRAWREMLRPWEARGLTRIRVIRKPPIFRAERAITDPLIPPVKDSRKEAKKVGTQQMSLL